MYASPEAYNGYAHALHSKEELIKAAEAGLVVLFLAHIALAIITTLENRSARPDDYERKETKKTGGLLFKSADTFMFVSGAVVLGFVLLHLADFTLEWRLKGPEGEEPYDKASRILKNGITIAVYLVGCLFLGAHLSHGFSSAFQSLGISHPKYDPWIKCLGILFAFVIAIGFISFLPWAWNTPPP